MCWTRPGRPTAPASWLDPPTHTLTHHALIQLAASSGGFDLVVLDEAGQATAPASWLALLLGRRAVLAGDANQAGPSSSSLSSLSRPLSPSSFAPRAAAGAAGRAGGGSLSLGSLSLGPYLISPHSPNISSPPVSPPYSPPTLKRSSRPLCAASKPKRAASRAACSRPTPPDSP